MTIEELLKRLEHERELEYMFSFRYGAEAQNAMLDDNDEDRIFYERLHDKSNENVKRLGITIEEIKKRVS